MTNFKLFKIVLVVVILCLVSTWGIPSYRLDSSSPTPDRGHVFQEDQQVEKKDQEKTKEEQKDLGDTLTRRMDEGEDMMDILGVSDLMPTTFDLIILWLIPMSMIIGVIFLVVILNRRRHQRIMAMIEKGVFKEGELAKYQPKPYNWRMLTSLIGLVLVLGGIGVSLYMIGLNGIEQWYTGTIPLLVGVAFLIFNRIYYKNVG